MAKIKTPNAVKDIEKLDHSYIVNGNVKLLCYPGKQFGSLKNS